MKKIFLAFLFPLTLFAQKPAKTKVTISEAQTQVGASKAEQYAASIKAADLQKHLRIIAADSMQGRETGTEGQKMAANYIATHFFMNGLQPVMNIKVDSVMTKGFYQPFQLIQRGWGEVYVRSNGYKIEWLKDFYLLGNLSIPDEIEADLVFAGYGIEDENYSDYKNLDLNGKAVLLFSGEPHDKKGKSLLTKTKKDSEWANNWRKKVAVARKKGAKYVFVVKENKASFKESVGQYQQFFDEGILTFNTQTPAQDNATFFVTPESAQVMLGFVKTPTNQTDILFDEKAWKKMNKNFKKGKGHSIATQKLNLKVKRNDEILNTENVLGLIEGTDKKDEIIVISAHYDHIGVNADGQINNGADDDGSGTSAVLELAEAFNLAQIDGFAPRRSILFMTVTGEEKGLFGSRYYTENPVFSLKNTVADLNIDMIGRLDKAHENNPDYVYLIGSDKLSSQLHKLSEEANKKYTKLALDYTYNDTNDPNRFYYRSDHYNFAKNGIPVIFYFNGVHDDYHMPTDDVAKINFQKMEKITRLVFYTAWELANRDERIKVDSNKK
ncbi:MAG: M28 family peptidase [Verrucomicrobia bacterium]|nr:M28 family peptidase [Cytophagales bacterium]